MLDWPEHVSGDHSFYLLVAIQSILDHNYLSLHLRSDMMSFWLLPVTRSEQIKAVIFILSCQFAYFINILSSEVKYYILFCDIWAGLISSTEIKSQSLMPTWKDLELCRFSLCHKTIAAEPGRNCVKACLARQLFRSHHADKLVNCNFITLALYLNT